MHKVSLHSHVKVIHATKNNKPPNQMLDQLLQHHFNKNI